MTSTLLNVLLVGAGGAIGAIGRYALGGLAHRWVGMAFPAGTFLVNAAGCLLFGWIAGLGTERVFLSAPARMFLLIGILGGFTTFSAYAYETIALARDGQWTLAAVNALGQVAAGLAGVWLGAAAGRAW